MHTNTVRHWLLCTQNSALSTAGHKNTVRHWLLGTQNSQRYGLLDTQNTVRHWFLSTQNTQRYGLLGTQTPYVNGYWAHKALSVVESAGHTNSIRHWLLGRLHIQLKLLGTSSLVVGRVQCEEEAEGQCVSEEAGDDADDDEDESLLGLSLGLLDVADLPGVVGLRCNTRQSKVVCHKAMKSQSTATDAKKPP